MPDNPRIDIDMRGRATLTKIRAMGPAGFCRIRRNDATITARDLPVTFEKGDVLTVNALSASYFHSDVFLTWTRADPGQCPE